MGMNARSFISRTSGLHGKTYSALSHLLSRGDLLKLGQAQIDAQHEAILAMAAELADRWDERGNLAEMKDLAEKFGKVLAAHFRYEEQLFDAAGTSNQVEHRAEHRSMLDQLHTIRGCLDQIEGNSSAQARGFDLRDFVLGVTVGHVCQSDVNYREDHRAADRIGQPV
jgi:hemerythrin-like metal-binding protein